MLHVVDVKLIFKWVQQTIMTFYVERSNLLKEMEIADADENSISNLALRQ